MARQMTDEARQLVEQLAHAQDIMDHVRWMMEGKRGFSKEAKRADTISGKIYNLMHMVYQNNRTWEE